MAKQKKATRKDRVKLFHIIQRHLRRKRKTGRRLLISVKDKFKSRAKPDHIFRDKYTTKYARGLLYFTHYHIHNYRDFRTGNKRLDESKQHSGRAFIGKRSGSHGLGAPIEEI